MDKSVIVTGGSSGIGSALCDIFAENGYRVFEISRSGQSRAGVTHISADVSDPAAARAAIDKAAELAGHVDILVNNAGFGISGAVEFTDPADAKRQLEVNFFGASECTAAAIPHMRKAGGGRIVNISSVAGSIPIPFQTYYSVSKAAINAFTLAVANEVRPFGISVCAVLPGDVHTGFTDARKKQPLGDDVYGGRISRSVTGMEKDERGGMSARYAAGAIYKVAVKKRVRPMYTAGTVYKLLMFVGRVLPKSALNRLVYAIYAK